MSAKAAATASVATSRRNPATDLSVTFPPTPRMCVWLSEECVVTNKQTEKRKKLNWVQKEEDMEQERQPAMTHLNSFSLRWLNRDCSASFSCSHMTNDASASASECECGVACSSSVSCMEGCALVPGNGCCRRGAGLCAELFWREETPDSQVRKCFEIARARNRAHNDSEGKINGHNDLMEKSEIGDASCWG